VLILKPLRAVLGRKIDKYSEEVLYMGKEDIAELINAEVEGDKYVECHDNPSFIAVSWIATYMVNKDKILNAVQNARKRGVRGLCFEWSQFEAMLLALGRLVHSDYAEWVETNGGAAEVRISASLNGVPVGGAVDVVYDDGEFVSVAELKTRRSTIADIQALIYAYILSEELGDYVRPYVVNTSSVSIIRYDSKLIKHAKEVVNEIWKIVNET
jgi:hypothetical protein